MITGGIDISVGSFGRHGLYDARMDDGKGGVGAAVPARDYCPDYRYCLRARTGFLVAYMDIQPFIVTWPACSLQEA